MVLEGLFNFKAPGNRRFEAFSTTGTGWFGFSKRAIGWKEGQMPGYYVCRFCPNGAAELKATFETLEEKQRHEEGHRRKASSTSVSKGFLSTSSPTRTTVAGK